MTRVRRTLIKVVVGLAAGPLIDRLSRKRLIVAADLARLAVFVALPFTGGTLAMQGKRPTPLQPASFEHTLREHVP